MIRYLHGNRMSYKGRGFLFIEHEFDVRLIFLLNTLV